MANPDPTQSRWHVSTRHATLVASLVAASLTCGIALSLHAGAAITIVLTITNGALMALVTAILLMHRASRAFLRAFDKGDLKRARALHEDMADALGKAPSMVMTTTVNEAAILAAENRFAEVISLLEPLATTAMAPRLRASLLNNLAFALSQSGQPRRAISLAQEAVALGARYPPAHRARFIGTLGTAHILAEEWDAGIEHLVAANALGSSDRDLAWREFHRGEGLRALGRAHDARDAYERACGSDSPPDLVERARARLKSLDAPFR
jgi:tetratricopeptide (TPR) repeat protein